MLTRGKYIILFYLAALFVLNDAQAQIMSKLDQKNGFKKFKFGKRQMNYLTYNLTEREWKGETEDAIKPEIENHIRRFDVTLEEEDTYIGPYNFTALAIYFYNERLYEVVVGIESEKHFLGVLETLKSQYGPPTSGKNKKEDYKDQDIFEALGNTIVWDGTRVRLQFSYDNTQYNHDGNYSITNREDKLPANPLLKGAVLSFTSKGLTQKMDIYLNKKKVKAGKDL